MPNKIRREREREEKRKKNPGKGSKFHQKHFATKTMQAICLAKSF